MQTRTTNEREYDNISLLYAFSIRPACNLLAYTFSLVLLYESVYSMCPQRTDLDKQTNKQTNKHYSKISACSCKIYTR